MSWNPGSSNAPPEDFYNILLGDETESEEEFAISDEEIDAEESVLELWAGGSEGPPVGIVADGDDVGLPRFAAADVGAEVELTAASPTSTLDEQAVSPSSSPVRDRSPVHVVRERSPVRSDLPPFSLVIEPGRSRGTSLTRRGRADGRATARRGRGGAGGGRPRASMMGRGGRGRQGGGGVGGDAWVRGGPLRPVFIHDEDLPEDLRREIDTYIASRRPRGREAGEEENNEELEQYFDAEEFVWESMDPSTTSSNKENFRVECPGPTRRFPDAYSAFRAYWDDEILSHIVTETNEYAQGIQSQRFHQVWTPTNLDEILRLFAFWMMLGIVRMPSINSCFSSNPLLKTSIFRSLFKQERYWHVNRAFQLARGSVNTDNPQDVLYPIRHVLDHANTKFQELYVLHQEISIDESLTLWKGPCKFKQYIKTKSARFGIKTQQLCESATGYLWAFFVYIGAATSNSTLPSSSSTVLQLIRPLLNLGHTLYMDNWFNSPRLARYLKRQGTDCVGTLRPSRQEVPRVIQRAPLVEGEYVARTSGDVRVVALQDRKRLHLISTCHDLSQVQKEARPGHPAQYKLKLVDDYNHGMGGIDKMDQMLEPYLVERKKCRKWSRKLFKRVLNASIQNSRILVEATLGTKLDSLVFRLTLVKSIMERHGDATALAGLVPRENALNLELRGSPLHYQHNFPASRLTSRCFIVRIESGLRRQCVLCSYLRKTKKTSYTCLTCEANLCLESCFQDFHTVPL